MDGNGIGKNRILEELEREQDRKNSSNEIIYKDNQKYFYENITRKKSM